MSARAWSWADVQPTPPEWLAAQARKAGRAAAVAPAASDAPATHAVWSGAAGAYLNADASGFAREDERPGVWARAQADRIVRGRAAWEACASIPWREPADA